MISCKLVQSANKYTSSCLGPFTRWKSTLDGNERESSVGTIVTLLGISHYSIPELLTLTQYGESLLRREIPGLY